MANKFGLPGLTRIEDFELPDEEVIEEKVKLLAWEKAQKQSINERIKVLLELQAGNISREEASRRLGKVQEKTKEAYIASLTNTESR